MTIILINGLKSHNLRPWFQDRTTVQGKERGGTLSPVMKRTPGKRVWLRK